MPLPISTEVHGAQEVLEGPWVTWETTRETEVAFPLEGLGVPKGTPLEEGTSSWQTATGSIQIQAVETQTHGSRTMYY